MSNVLGVNATKAADPKPANILAPGNFAGKLRVMVDTYTASGLASGSTIKMGGVLPAGAIVTGSKLAFAALGSGVTLSVGDSDTAARYKSAIAATSAGFDSTVVAAGLGYVVGQATGDNQVLITTGGASATGLIVLITEYTVE